MGDFFAFRKMISGVVIQIVFVIGLLLIVVGGVGAITQDQALAGLLILVFGGLYWRILCEVLIVIFRMNDSLKEIKAHTAGISAAFAGGQGTSAVPAAAAVVASTPVATVRPEGWYDDPERSGRKRWWTGTAWGMRDDEHPSRASLAAPVAAEATDEGTPQRDSEPANEIETATTPAGAPAQAETEPTMTTADQPASEAEAPETRFCENCGAERRPGAQFCSSCGYAQ